MEVSNTPNRSYRAKALINNQYDIRSYMARDEKKRAQSILNARNPSVFSTIQTPNTMLPESMMD